MIDLWSVLLIAIALAMDAFSVSVCSGMTMAEIEIPLALRIAGLFGAFQAIMPLLGWLGGTGLNHLISGFDHWIAFGLLAIVGGRMIYEAFQGDRCEKIINPRKLLVLLMLAVATSVDALAVGLSFALLEIAIIAPILVIGSVTFALSLVGTLMGKRFGGLLENKAEMIGGLILIGIGIRILVQDLAPGGLAGLLG